MEQKEIQYTPLNDWHLAHSGKMVPFAGFSMPVRYSGDKQEHLTVRNKVGLFDVSHMGEFIVEGPEALDLVQFVFSNDASQLAIGEIQYGYLPNLQGGIVDDLLVYRLGDLKYLLVVNASNIAKDFEWIASHNTFEASLTDISDQMCLFALQGPLALEVMADLVGDEVKHLKYYTFDHYSFGEFQDVFVSATGYTGAGGVELMIPNQQAVALWELLIKAGAPYGILPIGLGARDTLRLEKGYCLYGNDIDETTSPYEAGLGWVTKLHKKTVASGWLEDQKTQGIARKLVGFKMMDKGIPRSHYAVMDANENIIGEVTSGTMSPSLDLGIGMAYIQKGAHQAGQEVFIAVRNKLLKAIIVKIPFL